MKYKIGDKVKVISTLGGMYNKIGIIIDTSKHYDWIVRFGSADWTYNSDELQLIKQKSKYKYSRKEILERLGFVFNYKGEYLAPNTIDGEDFYKLFMAKQYPDKEEQPIKSKEIEFEEIKELKSLRYQDSDAIKMFIKINELVRNQNKLIQEVNKLKTLIK